VYRFDKVFMLGYLNVLFDSVVPEGLSLMVCPYFFPSNVFIHTFFFRDGLSFMAFPDIFSLCIFLFFPLLVSFFSPSCFSL
jgi:hypothetical protein